MTDQSYQVQIDELLSNLPAFQPISYYNRNSDTIRFALADCHIVSNPILSCLTSNREKESGTWVGFELHHTGWLASKLHLNPTKTSRFIASIFNLYIKTFHKNPKI